MENQNMNALKVVVIGLLLNMLIANINFDTITNSQLSGVTFANNIQTGVIGNYIGEEGAVTKAINLLRPSSTKADGTEKGLLDGILTSFTALAGSIISGLESILSPVAFVGALILFMLLSIVSNPITFWKVALSMTNPVFILIGIMFALIITFMNYNVVMAFITLIKGRGVKQ